MKNFFDNATRGASPTGRLQHGELAVQTVKSRSSFCSSLTPRQREVLAMLVDDKLEIEGRVFTRSDLLCIFSGQQIPRDPKVCEFLGLTPLLADYTSLERRVMAYQKD